ncbi:translation initiation factor IF-3, mitochondrial isoform X2 [Hyla sarda]|nr:translation initiation factor IF-3, mitochondrial isoform X2 [Hyla sarda]XP_056417776.1 translation initiation factor IF-3, mitochondrial isoform X2 [Hyla sarda]XP_056417777.1 translation initiation factor IF-3, mitochondrial isoform X2 [Hyla sarda]XP_056417778.1 translation initiation factor IF-3, mitochondrial isoform X2 [Hyla sarda]XP_056417780.1 translation initiation factor IF-3, mitochondrial isoform X2 [Hyla sarda]XP_056417781.1 translation initiation factor IF-3, mitochondrial isofo
MSGFHLKKMFCQAASNSRCYFGRHFGLCHKSFKTTSYLPWNSIGWMRKGLLAADLRSYSTTEEDAAKKPNVTKKVNANARKVIGNVGRIIPYKIIQVLNKDGEDMGKMLKRDVIRMMEKDNLKLVAVSQNADPPVYKMLTGKELHEEQLKLREQQKQSTSPGPVQIKEMSFLASISQHDLDVKRKQLIHWIEKKHHIRITVLNSRITNGPDKLEVLQQLIESMADCATCMVQPKERKDGRAMICVLRPLSDKELQKRHIGAPASTEKTDTKDNIDQDNKDHN